MRLPELAVDRSELGELRGEIGPRVKLGVRKVAPDEPQRVVAIEQRLQRPAGCEAERAAEVAVFDHRQRGLLGAEDVVSVPEHDQLLEAGAVTGLGNRRRNTLRGRREIGVPLADRTGVAEGGAGEFEREGMRIAVIADVLPIEDVLTHLRVPARRRRAHVPVAICIGRRVREREEGGPIVVGIAGPPAD